MKKLLKDIVKKIFVPIEKKFIWMQNKKIIKEGMAILLPPPGIGNILLVCEYVNSYKKIHNNVPVIAVTNKVHLQISELFDEEIKMIVVKAKVTETLIKSDWLEKLGSKIYDSSHPSENLRQAITYSMSLESDCSFVKPRKFISEDIEKRVVIFTDAKTNSMLISDKEWRNIAKILSQKGYKVYFNSNEKERWSGYETIWYSIWFDFENTIKFVSESIAVIGYRSGILDLICECTERPMLVFYPNERNMEYLSLPANYTVKEKRIVREYIYDPKKFEDYVYTFCDEVL